MAFVLVPIQMRFALVALLCTLATPLAAQIDWPNYAGLRLNVGVLPLSGYFGVWELDFYDDFDQYVFATRTFEGGTQPVSLGLAIEGGTASGMHYAGFFDITLRAPLALHIGAEAGYNFAPLGFLLRPKLGIAYGHVSARLGTIANTPSGLVINGSAFIFDEIDVSLRQNDFVLRPGIDFVIPVSDHLGLTASVHYQFSVADLGQRVAFREGETEEEELIARERVDAENVFLYRNGTQRSTLDFRVQGVGASIGVVYRFVAY